jgi:hypothetical protein
MAAGATYEPIATTKLTSAQSSVTFSSLGSYTDLRIVIAAGNASGISAVGVRYNSDSGSNYSWTRLYGDGSTATSNRGTNDTAAYFGIIGTSIAETFLIDIMNYKNTNVYKTAISRTNDPANYVGTYVNLWRNTAAITSLTFLNSNGGNFPTDSTFTLYGIAAA